MRVSLWTLLREALSTAVSSEAASNARDSERGAEPEAQAATDLAIMQRVQSREQQALSLFYDRYARLALGFGLRILRDSSEGPGTGSRRFSLRVSQESRF